MEIQTWKLVNSVMMHGVVSTTTDVSERQTHGSLVQKAVEIGRATYLADPGRRPVQEIRRVRAARRIAAELIDPATV